MAKDSDDLTIHEQTHNFIADYRANPFPSPMYDHTEVMFNLLAVQLAKYQYDTIPAYKKWVDHKSQSHGHPWDWHRWQDILPFPIPFFKRMDVGTPGEQSKVWLSSGTTSANRSRTPLFATDFYDLAISRESRAWLGGRSEDFLHIGLMPYAQDWPNSSLAYMFDQIFPSAIRPITLTESGFELDMERVTHSLNHALENNWPVRLFGTSYAFIKMFESIDPIELPPGSELIDTGGYKGVVADRTRGDFIVEAMAKLGTHVTFINEYGMSEMSSQFWSRWEAKGADEMWTAPYWVRTKTVNPVTYEDDPNGVLVVYDLANVWVPFALQTEDLATVHHQSLWPLGRARGAVAKGCSLTVESALSGGILQ